MELLKVKDFSHIFPIDYPIIFLHAHPDDEAFLNVGIMVSLIKSGRKCYNIFCAAGINLENECSLIRQKEARHAGRCLNMTSVAFLNINDSGFSSNMSCSRMNIQDIELEYNSCLRDLGIKQPYVLVSYDYKGGYGHVDHVKTHEIGKRIAKNAINSDILYFESTINRNLYANWFNVNSCILNSNQLPELRYWSAEFGTQESEISYKYELTDEELKIKKQILSIYKSQINPNLFPLTLSPEDFKLLFGYEYLNT
ncbi:MAG: PIG-L family deacetylase [Candidatus Gracilibacteria bacterium]|nr:PIG-L family deacetylase [Candidatus Gracilibacteria bacterium]